MTTGVEWSEQLPDFLVVDANGEGFIATTIQELQANHERLWQLGLGYVTYVNDIRIGETRS